MTKRYIIMFAIYTVIMAGVYTLVFSQAFVEAFIKAVVAGLIFVGLYYLLMRWIAKRGVKQ
jgi:hypothetical protein